MRILCTNDDGIHAPGLKVVEEIARKLSDDVWIVAPELDQSGVSHSLSLNDPLRLREVGPRHFAIRGTPTDCVIMGARHILGQKLPDIVLSGVNKGRNVAEDVVYSGTIAGALEGTILGLPSFALSQEFTLETRERPLWDTALQFGPAILRKVIAAYPAARDQVPGLRMIVVTGPRIDPAALPAHDGLEIRSYVHDLYRHLAVCDLAVVQGGLATAMELTASRRPFLYFPLRGHFEQNLHVRHRLERYRAGRCLDFDAAAPADIAAAIAAEIGRDVDYRPVATGGAARAAAMLASLL